MTAVLPIGLLLSLAIVGPAHGFPAALELAASSIAISLVTAILTTRWSGRSSAIPICLFTLAGWLICGRIMGPEVMHAASAASLAILIYGLAELPNRSKPLPRRPAAIGFYTAVAIASLLAGLAPVVAIATVCLGTVLGIGNSRGIRFFGSPVGLILFALAAGTVLAVGTEASVVPRPSVSVSPLFSWTAVTALLLGIALSWTMIRTGHAAAPLGRLLVSWLLGPTGLATAGWLPVSLAIAITLPAWAALAALALVHLPRCYHGKQILPRLTLPWLGGPFAQARS